MGECKKVGWWGAGSPEKLLGGGGLGEGRIWVSLGRSLNGGTQGEAGQTWLTYEKPQRRPGQGWRICSQHFRCRVGGRVWPQRVGAGEAGALWSHTGHHATTLPSEESRTLGVPLWSPGAQSGQSPLQLTAQPPGAPAPSWSSGHSESLLWSLPGSMARANLQGTLPQSPRLGSSLGLGTKQLQVRFSDVSGFPPPPSGAALASSWHSPSTGAAAPLPTLLKDPEKTFLFLSVFDDPHLSYGRHHLFLLLLLRDVLLLIMAPNLQSLPQLHSKSLRVFFHNRC